jgi:hypothetical protein
MSEQCWISLTSFHLIFMVVDVPIGPRMIPHHQRLRVMPLGESGESLGFTELVDGAGGQPANQP